MARKQLWSSKVDKIILFPILRVKLWDISIWATFADLHWQGESGKHLAFHKIERKNFKDNKSVECSFAHNIQQQKDPGWSLNPDTTTHLLFGLTCDTFYSGGWFPHLHVEMGLLLGSWWRLRTCLQQRSELDLVRDKWPHCSEGSKMSERKWQW